MKRAVIVLSLLAMGRTAAAGSGDLETILEKAAQYCARLEKAAFSCVCVETVRETISNRAGRRRRREFRYDYQVIGQGGRVTEARTLVAVDGAEVAPQPDARQQSENYSYFSVYAPVFLLGRKNQANYRFRLLGSETLGRVGAWVLAVEPRAEGAPLSLHGRVWLDRRDGSVMRIDVNPEALGGFARQQENARRIGARLEMSDIHWYGIVRMGIRFPTRTEIKEKYVSEIQVDGSAGAFVRGSRRPAAGDNLVWTRSHTVFTYDRYRFFTVGMEVREELDRSLDR